MTLRSSYYESDALNSLSDGLAKTSLLDTFVIFFLKFVMVDTGITPELEGVPTGRLLVIVAVLGNPDDSDVGTGPPCEPFGLHFLAVVDAAEEEVVWVKAAGSLGSGGHGQHAGCNRLKEMKQTCERSTSSSRR